MSLAVKVVTVICFLLYLGCAFGQPPKPNPPRSFSANVTEVIPGYANISGALYIDYEKLKERSVLTVTKSMENNVWIIMDAMSNTTCTSYGVFTPFTFCDVGRGQCDPSLFDYWYFLVEGNCTYVGTKEFEGVKVDVWDCVDGGTELGVLSSDPNRPVYVYFVGSGVVIFETFNKSVPPPSVFDIPPNCKSQEGRKEPTKKHQDRKGFFKL